MAHATSAPAEQEIALGHLPPLKLATMPVYAGLLAYLGPGILWAALAQGSGELIWWPYLTAKYGAAFLGLLIPAALLQYWYNLEICRYTVLTGETPMTGFTRMAPWYAWMVWIGIFVENIWFGAYASAGGTAMAALTNFPNGWEVRDQSLFWGYSTIGVYLVVLFVGSVAYTWVERISMAVVVITMVGITFAVFQKPVLAVTGNFFAAVLPHYTSPASLPNWDESDWNIVVTSIAFAGAGGFGQLFLAYWMRDKGVGMGQRMGRVTSPLTGKAETIPATGYVFADSAENRRNYGNWVKYFSLETGIGVALNLITTLIMCWLAFALLLPKGIVPKGWEIAVVQATFFEVSWGTIGKSLFLIVAAAFLCDAWLQLTDGYSRIQADFFYSNIKGAQRLHYRTWYYIFVVVFSVLTMTTMSLAQPGTLIMIRGVISFLAMALIGPALIYMNYVMLPRAFPKWIRPHPVTMALMTFCTLAYVGMAIAYIVLNFEKLRGLFGA